jgi:hypothetical protein
LVGKYLENQIYGNVGRRQNKGMKVKDMELVVITKIKSQTPEYQQLIPKKHSLVK